MGTLSTRRGGGVGLRPHTPPQTHTHTHSHTGGRAYQTRRQTPLGQLSVKKKKKKSLGGGLTAGISQPPAAPKRRLQGASLNFRRACDVSTRRRPLGRLPAEMWAGGRTGSRWGWVSRLVFAVGMVLVASHAGPFMRGGRVRGLENRTLEHYYQEILKKRS